MEIQRHTVTTKAGNTLILFYNPENDLVVVDLIHKNGKGGCELFREKLTEDHSLRHCVKKT